MRQQLLLVAALLAVATVAHGVTPASEASKFTNPDQAPSETPQRRTFANKHPSDKTYTDCMARMIRKRGGFVGKNEKMEEVNTRSRTFQTVVTDRVFRIQVLQAEICANDWTRRKLEKDMAHQTNLAENYKKQVEDYKIRGLQNRQMTAMKNEGIAREKAEDIDYERKGLADKNLRMEKEIERMQKHHRDMGKLEDSIRGNIEKRLQHEENVRRIMHFNNKVHFTDKIFRMQVKKLAKKKFAKFVNWFTGAYLKDAHAHPRTGMQDWTPPEDDTPDHKKMPVDHQEYYDPQPGAQESTPQGGLDHGDDVGVQGTGTAGGDPSMSRTG